MTDTMPIWESAAAPARSAVWLTELSLAGFAGSLKLTLFFKEAVGLSAYT